MTAALRAIDIAPASEIAPVFRLRPRIHPRISSLLERKDILFSLIETFGSPLNIVFPGNIHENIRDFQDAYKKHRLQGRIYFSSKPCKSRALMREASGTDIGIDVSSPGSLRAALDCGWESARIGATGPKNMAYLTEALQNDILINVDNIDELKQIHELHGALALPRKVRITIRIAGHGGPSSHTVTSNDTVFGIGAGDIDWVITFLKNNAQVFSFLGFSYHASLASDEQRMAAMENQLSLTFHAIKSGLAPSTINIGGGFSIMYADSCREWVDYTHAIKESILGKIPSQTWNNNGLGYRLENGVLRGGPVYINHAPVYTKGEELDRWLSFRMPSFGNAAFADIVRDSLMRLSVEPGRGMLDQCGITLGRVAFTKKSGHGENLAGLEMNRSNLHSNDFKLLTEPVVISRDDAAEKNDGEGVFYMGNLCLSYDMLQHNKTYPAVMPRADDLVVFINTAAYMMDFTESEILMQPIARKIAATFQNDEWTTVPDEDYRRPQ
jgi:diaminopimelate decarboxylase